MMMMLVVSSLLATVLVTSEDIDLLISRTIALTATLFEIVWLVATGFIQYGQIQRQNIIDNASDENV